MKFFFVLNSNNKVFFVPFKFQEDCTNELGDARVDKHEENRRKKKQVKLFLQL